MSLTALPALLRDEPALGRVLGRRSAVLAVPEPARAEPGADRGIAAPQKGAQSAGPPRPLGILLVEDHADTAFQLSRLLRKLGHEVTVASSVAEARAAAESLAAGGSLDLVLSDLGLPDGTGHDLMRELSQRYRLHGIALSGYGMEEDVRASLEAGFECHLTKPVNWEALREIIAKFAAGANGESIRSAPVQT